MRSLIRSRRSTASATGTATAEPREKVAAINARRFSPLTRRILVLNMLPLALLAGGLIFLGQYEDELIDSEISSLRVQAEIVAAGLGEGAVRGVDAGRQQLDNDLAAQVVVRLVQPTGVRARLFSPDGEMIADTLNLPGITQQRIEVYTLPPPSEPSLAGQVADWLAQGERWLLFRRSYPTYGESAVQLARDYDEVYQALRGGTASAIRADRGDRLILSVAVPVQRYKEVLGALMLSHDNASIASSMRQVRLDILKIAFVALIATVLLSLYLAGTIVRPIRRVASAAARVRSSSGDKPAIPDLSERDDEIGDLSQALRDMTEALWQRMNAIERFAADVAHELKNPLTSLRSAIETAARIENPEQRAKLMDIVLDDINRLNRLISDISESSRLDAELMRARMGPVDVGALIENMLNVYRGTEAEARGVTLKFISQGRPPFRAVGHEGRYSQVFRNLIDNALTFSPRGGTLTATLRREAGGVVVTVDDEGPGIPENKLEAIFDRFYSERPAGEQFGTHSGLGLSIARQIVDAYRGSITAENRRDEAGEVIGARFTVKLPLA